jgi:hypothetical protein
MSIDAEELAEIMAEADFRMRSELGRLRVRNHWYWRDLGVLVARRLNQQDGTATPDLEEAFAVIRKALNLATEPAANPPAATEERK